MLLEAKQNTEWLSSDLTDISSFFEIILFQKLEKPITHEMYLDTTF
jgi:hypothetical protein